MDYLPIIISLLSIGIGIGIAYAMASFVTRSIVKMFSGENRGAISVDWDETVPVGTRRLYLREIQFYLRQIERVVFRRYRISPNRFPVKIYVKPDCVTYAFNNGLIIAVGTVDHISQACQRPIEVEHIDQFNTLIHVKKLITE
jgi:hypothetical protein